MKPGNSQPDILKPQSVMNKTGDAGQAILASDMWHGTGARIGGLLMQSGALIVSVVMLKNSVFNKLTTLEYGGWGVRFGKGGKAFNVSGNRGLKLYLKSGRSLLIGTQKDKELIAFLSELK